MANCVAISGLFSRQIGTKGVGNIYQGHKRHDVQREKTGHRMGADCSRWYAGLALLADLEGMDHGSLLLS